MIPSKILAPILASVAFVAGAAVALPSIVAGDEPAPRRDPLVLEEARQTPEPQPTLRPKPRPDDRGEGRPGQGTAVPFVIVATLTLLAVLVGWRLVATLVQRGRARRSRTVEA